jgi:hypothetical protein
VVQYTGGKADRAVIREHEFHWAGDRGKRRPLKFDVLLVRASLLAMKPFIQLGMHVLQLWMLQQDWSFLLRGPGSWTWMLHVLYWCLACCAG